jgi:hypothetical protein
LRYYQGFHDVVTIVLFTVDDDALAFECCERMSRVFFSDFMQADFDVFSKAISIVTLLLQLIDPELSAHMLQAGVEPFFCTSWLLTWFAHDAETIDEAARLFDALLCSHPLYIIYLVVAVSYQHDK